MAIRRHWQLLVCCAFSFCWWAYWHLPTEEPTETEDTPASSSGPAGTGKKEAGRIVAGGAEGGEGWLEPYVMFWRYWRAYTDLPPPEELRAPLERKFAGEGLYLYVHQQQTTGRTWLSTILNKPPVRTHQA